MYLILLNLLFEGKKYLASTPQTNRNSTQIGAHAHGTAHRENETNSQFLHTKIVIILAKNTRELINQ